MTVIITQNKNHIIALVDLLAAVLNKIGIGRKQIPSQKIIRR